MPSTGAASGRRVIGDGGSRAVRDPRRLGRPWLAVRGGDNNHPGAAVADPATLALAGSRTTGPGPGQEPAWTPGRPDPSMPALAWTLPTLRKAWNQAKTEVAPWWPNCSKEAYGSGIADLVAALNAWSTSPSTDRRAGPGGVPPVQGPPPTRPQPGPVPTLARCALSQTVATSSSRSSAGSVHGEHAGAWSGWSPRAGHGLCR